MNEITEHDITNCWSQYHASYLADILNGKYSVDEARKDLQSLIGTAWDSRTVAAAVEAGDPVPALSSVKPAGFQAAPLTPAVRRQRGEK